MTRRQIKILDEELNENLETPDLICQIGIGEREIAIKTTKMHWIISRMTRACVCHWLENQKNGLIVVSSSKLSLYIQPFFSPTSKNLL